MKHLPVLLALTLVMTSCHKTPSPKTTGNTKLNTIQFTDADNGTQDETLTVHYNGSTPDYLTLSQGATSPIKVVYTYSNGNPVKIAFEDSVGNLQLYYTFSYNNNGQVDTRKLYDVSGGSGLTGFWEGYKFDYTNGIMTKATGIDSNGNIPQNASYIRYVYDGSNSIDSMITYWDDTVAYYRTYTSSSNTNNLKDIIPQFAVIAIWTQANDQTIWDDETYLETLFNNSKCISSATWTFKDGEPTAQFNYTYTYDTQGKILTQDDQRGAKNTYTYQ